MPIYKAPLRDQQFVLHEVLGAVGEFNEVPRYADLDVQTVNHVVEEAGKFCEEWLLPTNMDGDIEGCTFYPTSKAVKTPKGFKEAY
ncbi:MAG TPA: acyl-CoA dehydrogenase N-terminal domain-containing protein, partial [Burkholderiaceae bacterium]|nr:acyl-CoA dehydrogenase N-terminal domain-containing protein [Burkholderiaceae bacterium]